MKVSLFVHELSSNPIVRAYPIAKAIELLGHEVEVLGLTYNTDQVYEPYKDEYEYKTIRSFYDIRWVIINSIKLAKMATGDVVYAFKPVWDSYFPALLYSGFGIKKRLILDAEDNELWDAYNGNGWKDLKKNKFFPVNPVYNKILHPLTFFVKRKSVVCKNLQKRYGGKIILHGPKNDKFNPELYASTKKLRSNFNLPENVPLVLFAGTSVYYNGLDSIVKALLSEKAWDWHLILVGNPKNEGFRDAKTKLQERCHLLGFIPNNKMPEIIKMCDVSPIIQTPIPSTEYQIPAKMLESMAMGKGIITTNVSDMQNIIGNKNGWIIPHNNTETFSNLLNFLQKNPEELTLRGINARKYFLKNASIERIAERIRPFFT